ncbi:MAG: hypothetical protein K8R90_03345 [Candidatus Cloacimonetes bacterium]|nr:hypothetical protein [Candidatus Cloacimonadota bacterium]
MYRMDDKHLEVAKEIALKHRRKKNCDHCYDRAYIGTTTENMLMICHKCVDMDAAVEAWNEYVETQPDLKEHFGKLEKPAEGEEHKTRRPQGKQHIHNQPDHAPVMKGHKAGDR